MKWIAERLRDPFFAREFHKWATISWFILAFPVCIFLSSSLPFIVFISVYAVVVGHWSAFQAAQADIEAQKSNPNSNTDSD